MVRFRLFWTAIILGAVAAGNLWALTRCVDLRSGSDSNAGTVVAPWQSLAKALAQVKDGDIVLLRAGSYGTLKDNRKHRAFVTFKADEGAWVILEQVVVNDSAYLRVEGVKVAASVNAYGADHFELINAVVEFAGDRYKANKNTVDIRHTTNALVKRCVIANGRTAIKADVTTNAVISGNHIYNFAVDAITATPAQNLLVESNHIHNINQDRLILKDYSTASLFTAFAPGATVRDSPQRDLTIRSASAGVIIMARFAKPVNFANFNDMGLYITPSSICEQGDLIVRVSQEPNAVGGSVDIPVFACKANVLNKKGVHLPKALAEMREARSVALVKRKSGEPCYVSVAEWNFSSGSHQDFLVISGSNIIIRGNIFHDGASQGLFTSPHPARNVIIENNLIYDLGGTNLTNLTLGGTSLIRNNTFIGSHRAGKERDPYSSNHFLGLVRLSGEDSNSRLMVVNNIVAGELAYSGNCANNIVHRQEGISSRTLVLSGRGVRGATFDQSLFRGACFTPHHGRILDFSLLPHAPAVNFGDPANQPADSLGSIDADGFIRDTGIRRDMDHHSAGAIEFTSVAGNSRLR